MQNKPCNTSKYYDINIIQIALYHWYAINMNHINTIAPHILNTLAAFLHLRAQPNQTKNTPEKYVARVELLAPCSSRL